jgi:undecaprenyl-diphosphatase
MLWSVIVLGIVEGLTEFLPISSTGHLILVAHWLGRSGPFWSMFEVVIQVGAILAVVVEYRGVFAGVLQHPGSPSSKRLVRNLLVGFAPAAVLGFVFHDAIKARLFGPAPVGWALIAGGVAMFVIERARPQARTRSLDEIGVGQSLAVGFAQCAALFPGFSRAAATILGGLLAGLDRPTAAQFSFFLAIPTLAGAAALDLAKGLGDVSGAELGWMALGLVVSFFAAWAAVRWFVRWVSSHSLDLFALYRLLLGAAVLWQLGALG